MIAARNSNSQSQWTDILFKLSLSVTEAFCKMKLPVVTIEGNIGAGKTTLLERFEHFLSSEDKFKIKINHEPVDEFQKF